MLNYLFDKHVVRNVELRIASSWASVVTYARRLRQRGHDE